MLALTQVVRTFPSARIPSVSGGLPVEVSLIAQLGHGSGDELFEGVMTRQQGHERFVDELDEPSTRLAGVDLAKGDSPQPHMGVLREVVVVYDKQCPACDYYCNMVRIRASVGHLSLLDARAAGPIMDAITARGWDIDQGMVVKVGDEMYYGSDAIHVLALLGTNKGLFNRIAYWLFRSKAVSRILYPVLKFLRNLLLKMLGKTKINNLGLEGHERF